MDNLKNRSKNALKYLTGIDKRFNKKNNMMGKIKLLEHIRETHSDEEVVLLRLELEDDISFYQKVNDSVSVFITFISVTIVLATAWINFFGSDLGLETANNLWGVVAFSVLLIFILVFINKILLWGKEKNLRYYRSILLFLEQQTIKNGSTS